MEKGHRRASSQCVLVNRKMKPIAHSIGVLNSIDPPHIVAIHEKIFTPVGTAMTIVAAVK